LNVAATVLPADAVIRMILAPPSPCNAAVGVRCRTVDVVVSAQALGEFRCVSPASNRYDLEPHVPGVLYAEMTKPADTKHGNKVAGLCRRVPQSTEM
jgi:hypothetical protein